jgi:hypothetical protein
MSAGDTSPSFLEKLLNLFQRYSHLARDVNSAYYSVAFLVISQDLRELFDTPRRMLRMDNPLSRLSNQELADALKTW